jgi:hypothetical protein
MLIQSQWPRQQRELPTTFHNKVRLWSRSSLTIFPFQGIKHV